MDLLIIQGVNRIMKKLLLLLLLSLSFVGSADTITYDNLGRGSDGSKCKENTIGGIDCSGGAIDGTVRYRSVGGINRFRGDDGSECKFNTIGRFICNRNSNNFNSVSYQPMTNSTASQGYMEGAAIGILVKSLIDAFGSSNTNTSSSSNSTPYIPRNAYKSGDGWKCKSGYYRSQNICKKLKSSIPPNSYSTSGTSEGWKCLQGFYKIGNSCTTKLPVNAYAHGYYDWSCNSGFRKHNNRRCIKDDSSSRKIPFNAYATSGTSEGWKCFSSHYKNNNSCIILPSNASAFGSGDGFYCYIGYKKSGARCIK